MWDILLTLCLAANPATCETRRRPGGADRAACVAEAAAAADAASDDTWRAQAWPCIPAGQTPPAAPTTEVAPGVHVRRGVHDIVTAANAGVIANGGFVVGTDAVAVIDPGGSTEAGRALRDAVRAITSLPVRWVILTHMHPDHVFGAAPFVEDGATVIGHRRLPPALAARAETYRASARDLLGPEFAPVEIAAPTETVSDVREIDLGERILRLEAHPVAHTDNDLTVRDLATDTWFLGDLVFMGHMPTLDGSLTGWIALMETLATRPAARVVPGHGPVAAPWPEAAAPLRTYLADLATEARAAIAAGEPLLAATRRIAARPAPGWTLAETYAERNATAAIRELEWE
jgi:quinoprotein relay system zinc metallohydrolase 2